MGKDDSEDNVVELPGAQEKVPGLSPQEVQEMLALGVTELLALAVYLAPAQVCYLDQLARLGAWGETREAVAATLVQQGLRELYSKGLITWPNAERMPAPAGEDQGA